MFSDSRNQLELRSHKLAPSDHFNAVKGASTGTGILLRFLESAPAAHNPPGLHGCQVEGDPATCKFFWNDLSQYLVNRLAIGNELAGTTPTNPYIG